MIIILKKNVFFKLDLLILTALKDQDRYGYDLCLCINTHTSEYFEVKEGVMYPILHKLLEDKYITSYSELHNNRNRVYYHLTDKGKERLEHLITEFELGVKVVKDFIYQ